MLGQTIRFGIRRRPLAGMLLGMAGLGLLALAGLNLPAVAHALDDPAFCGSCHVMAPQVESHRRSSHREALCGDCHLPRGPVSYPLGKAYAGAKDVAGVPGRVGAGPHPPDRERASGGAAELPPLSRGPDFRHFPAGRSLLWGLSPPGGPWSLTSRSLSPR